MDLDLETLNELEAFIAQAAFGAAQACIHEKGGDVDDPALIATLVTHGAARAMTGMILATSCAARSPKPNAAVAKESLSRFLDLVYTGLKSAESSGWYERQLEEAKRMDGAGLEQKLH